MKWGVVSAFPVAIDIYNYLCIKICYKNLNFIVLIYTFLVLWSCLDFKMRKIHLIL